MQSCVPQLFTPLVLVLTNLLGVLPTKEQLIFSYTSSQEYRKRDLQPFLNLSKSSNPGFSVMHFPLQLTTQILFWVKIRGLRWSWATFLFLGNHFWIDLIELRCIESLKTQWFWFKMPWYYRVFMIPCIHTRFPVSFNIETNPQHHRFSPYLTEICFSAYSFLVWRQTHLECFLSKSSILVSPDQST